MLLFFIGVAIYYFFKLLKYCREHDYYIWYLVTFQYVIPLNKVRRQILLTDFYFYNKLGVSDKKKFEKRVQHFLTNKTFVGANGFVVTERMKVMIAATAVLILLGRKAFSLSSFDRIEVFENEAIQLDVMRKKRIIQISWSQFENGFDFVTSGYNPGLKIMAMALDLEHQLGEDSIFNRHTYKAFHKIYKEEAQKYILSGKSKYDNYNKVDRNEYFGVAIEYFFERPDHFYANQPGMYLALSRLLRQDPLGMVTFKEREF
jgi:MtfA peptidase